MTSAQIRAARLLLKWTKTELAQGARIHRRTIANIEAERHVGSLHTLASLRRAFEDAGITFLPRLGSAWAYSITFLRPRSEEKHAQRMSTSPRQEATSTGELSTTSHVRELARFINSPRPSSPAAPILLYLEKPRCSPGGAFLILREIALLEKSAASQCC